MSQSPWITLTAGALGAVIGMASTFVSGTLTRRAARDDSQRGIANEILDLFREADPAVSLTSADSPERRTLFVLASQLRQESARKACHALVHKAGQPGVSQDDLFDAWQHVIDEVSKVSRK